MTVNVFMLVDRSGSMATRWEETISSINTYIEDLTKAKTRGSVTIACFDLHNGLSFDLLRDKVPFSKWSKIDSKEVSPRGSTPLYDAVSKIVALADEKGGKKTVIVIMTDGAENASKEVSKSTAEAMIKRCQDKEWQVVFLGADFNAFADASNIGVMRGQTLNMTKGNYEKVSGMLFGKTMSYVASGSSMSFTEQDRDEAEGKTKV